VRNRKVITAPSSQNASALSAGRLFGFSSCARRPVCEALGGSHASDALARSACRTLPVVAISSIA
jgi:hypothetical protein